MPKLTPKCPDCATEMEPGAIIDRGHGNTEAAARWVEGGETKTWSFLGIKTTSLAVSGHEVRTIQSFRCPRCGLLRNYAP